MISTESLIRMSLWWNLLAFEKFVFYGRMNVFEK